MGMSKKNYLHFAHILRHSTTKEEIINGMCKYFIEDNPRFDEEYFRFLSKGEAKNGI